MMLYRNIEFSELYIVASLIYPFSQIIIYADTLSQSLALFIFLAAYIRQAHDQSYFIRPL